MWNSPIKSQGNRGIKLTPQQIRFIAMELQSDGDMTFECGASEQLNLTTNLPEVFSQLNQKALFIRAVDVLEMLVSDAPVPEGGHNALDEAVLYGMLTMSFNITRDNISSYDEDDKKQTLDLVNALLSLADIKPLKNLRKFTSDDFDNFVDLVFFWDRDWELIEELGSNATPKTRELMGIDNDYFNLTVRRVTDKTLKDAFDRLNKLIDQSDVSSELVKNTA